MSDQEERELSVEEIEEIEAKRKAFRYRLVEAVEGAGWGIQLQGDDIVLGTGLIRLQALPFERVLIYAHIGEPSFSPEEAHDLNSESSFAAFMAPYVNTDGETLWAVFQRLALPEGEVSIPELGRWLDVNILNVLEVLSTGDNSYEEPDS